MGDTHWSSFSDCLSAFSLGSRGVDIITPRSRPFGAATGVRERMRMKGSKGVKRPSESRGWAVVMMSQMSGRISPCFSFAGKTEGSEHVAFLCLFLCFVA